jgi:putative multiple sugar transport system ATP-binding protein
VIDTGREFKVANDYRKALNIRCSGVEQLVATCRAATSRRWC